MEMVSGILESNAIPVVELVANPIARAVIFMNLLLVESAAL